jgi:hypothetical protein
MNFKMPRLVLRREGWARIQPFMVRHACITSTAGYSFDHSAICAFEMGNALPSLSGKEPATSSGESVSEPADLAGRRFVSLSASERTGFGSEEEDERSESS